MRPERGGRRARAARSAGGIAQLPWERIENPYPPMEPASAEQVEAIHRTSLRILSELGIKVMGGRVPELFAAAGAQVDRAEGLVRFDQELLDHALSSVPGPVTLCPRNPAHRVTIGGRGLVFGQVGGPPSVHDAVNGRRTGNMADYRDLTRLAQHFNVVHLLGNQVTAPQDLPANTRHLDTYHANLTLSDKVFHCSAIGRGRAMDAIRMVAIARGVTPGQMADEPGVLTVISVNSPRLFDAEMGEGLIAMAEHGQPVVITPFTLMGAMAPVTLAAALAQQNAEALFGVVLSQLVKPGAPVIYGAFTSNVDMRSGAPAFGTPENARANLIAGQLARRYGLPCRVSNANASNAVDLQAGYETMMATWGAVMGGANLIHHAAGWLEGGLTVSFEKLILDVEILQNMAEMLRPVDCSEDALGFEAIAGVPAGGHFFGAAHTMARYQSAFYRPLLSDWTNYEGWRAAGARDALARATDLWQRALRDYEEPPMDDAIREELDAYVARRKEEIGDGEP